MIAQALDLPAKTILQAWLVKTGWAIRPADRTTHIKILEAEPQLSQLTQQRATLTTPTINALVSCYTFFFLIYLVNHLTYSNKPHLF